jgi:hypothetical protein
MRSYEPIRQERDVKIIRQPKYRSPILATSASLAIPTAISFALFAQPILVEASCAQFAAHIASDWPLAGFPVSAAISFALLP